jgi:hypothetical protein
VRWLVEQRPGYLVHLLITAKILADGLGTFMLGNTGDRLSLQAILIMLGLMAPAQMILYLYVFTWLVKWTGALLGGHASAMDLRTALAWACVPLLVSVILTAPQLALFGIDLFRSDGPELDSWASTSAFYGLALLDVVLALWWLVAVVLALAEAQRFAWWKAVANYLLAIAAMLAPLFAAAYFFMGTSSW